MAIEKSYIDMLKERDAKIEALKELLALAHESLDSKDAKIAELDKECINAKNYTVDLSKTVTKYGNKIAELEKERGELNIQVEVLTHSDAQNYELYSELLFSPNEPPKNLELHNFTQQAKGAMDYIEWGIVNIDPEYCELEDCAREYGELLISGKLPAVEALRKQGFHYNGPDF
jgi:septal ring factor EnvC (AmiA/AmiB activator)